MTHRHEIKKGITSYSPRHLRGRLDFEPVRRTPPRKTYCNKNAATADRIREAFGEGPEERLEKLLRRIPANRRIRSININALHARHPQPGYPQPADALSPSPYTRDDAPHGLPENAAAHGHADA